MKRLLKILFIVCMCLSLAGCNKKDDEEANMKNPVVEYDSLEKINEIAGTNIVSCSVMGKSDERYSVIADKVAQYNFTLNGYNFTFRAAKDTKEDICGIHDEHNEFVENQDAIIYLTDHYIYRFFDNEIQYSIVLDKPEGYDEEAFTNGCLELENAVKGNYPPTMDELVGDYQDTYSQRATAHIEKDEDTLVITVSWADSANTVTTWTMYGKLDCYRIDYAGESISIYEYDDEGNETVFCTASNNIGYFDYEDGVLYWDGAGDENNRNCAFVKCEQQ